MLEHLCSNVEHVQISSQLAVVVGDPIAPFLFLFCAQIIYLLINNNSSIKCIFNRIFLTEYKISQYADDTTLILNRSKESLLTALSVLETLVQSLDCR